MGDHFLADQAARWLDGRVSRRAGSDISGDGPLARLDAPAWTAHPSLGSARHQLVGVRRVRVYGLPFVSFDYQHSLLPKEAVRKLLGLSPGQVEFHQCLILHVAAVTLLPPPTGTPTSAAPDAAAVHRLAATYREALLHAALAALGQLAPLSNPDELITASESEVRLFAHDFVTRDHDKDVRCLGAFLLPDLAGLDLYVLAVDYYGSTVAECLRFPARG